MSGGNAGAEGAPDDQFKVIISVDGKVTETFDHSAKRCPGVVAVLGIPTRAGTAIDATLRRLQARFA